MINVALEKAMVTFLSQMENRSFNTDSGNIVIALAIFYVGRAIFELARNVGNIKFLEIGKR